MGGAQCLSYRTTTEQIHKIINHLLPRLLSTLELIVMKEEFDCDWKIES